MLLGTTLSIIVIVTMFLVNKLMKNKKKSDENILLRDPEEKYEVELIEKEVSSSGVDCSTFIH